MEDEEDRIESPSGNTSRPTKAIPLGDNSWYTKVVDKTGKWVGINEWHIDSKGEYCGGWVPFDVEGATSSTKWTVVSYNPLELSPSLLCGCGSHGFIRQGQWVSC